MSNLSDLLPAGASAKQITATDSGSGIASKAPVIMNASGTVTQVGTVTQAVGSPVVFEAADIGSGQGDVSIACDTSNNKIVIAYTDVGNSSHGTAIVGTVSDTGISYGTAVVFNNQTTTYPSVCFDSSNNKIVIAYRDGGASNHGKAIVGTVSGTSISFGTAVTFESANSDNISATFDTNSNKVVIAYGDDGNSSYGTAIVGTVSGTSISFGSPTVYESANSKQNSAIFDSSNNKIVIAYKDFGNSGYGTSVVGTVSGTGISFGSPVVYSAASGDYISATFDSSNNKVVITYQDGSDYGNAIVGTVSGTSISFGTGVVYEAAVTNYGVVVFNSDANKVAISYSDNGNSDYGTMIVGTVSGTSISFGSPVVFAGSGTAKYLGTGFDSTSNRVVTAYQDGNNSNYGTSVVLRLAGTNVNATNFVGVADSAISASAAGSIIVQGGTVTGPTADVTVSQSLSSPFLFAQDAAGNGAVAAMASATGSSNILIAYYVNDGVTLGARVNAGTITSGNISYGSSAVIGMATSTIYYYDIANTSSSNKFVVFWQDQADSYIYGAVVTLTGNSISYGGTTTIYSAAAINNYDTFNSTYDPDTDRVILGVCNNSDTYAYSIVIEIGSTTIDTVGTPEKIDSSSAANGYAKKIDLCYDTTENKVIATYINVGGGGSYYLRVAAGTVTGGATNSTTWGSSSVVYAGDVTYPSIAYNATDQRVVIVYKQAADAKGYSSVATVSGTTVTANTPSQFYDPASTGGYTMYYTSLAHDSYMNKMVVYMRASAGDAVTGAINTASNSITWSSVFNAEADAYNPPQTEFDVGTNQVILLGAGTSLATAKSYIYTVPGTVTGQPLTTGTKYYVTSTGTFSSSADTPSVNAGLAISTTSLLLNGDS